MIRWPSPPHGVGGHPGGRQLLGQCGLALAPSGKGVSPPMTVRSAVLNLELLQAGSAPGEGEGARRGLFTVLCPPLLPPPLTSPVLHRQLSEAPPQLETIQDPWVASGLRRACGDKQGLQPPATSMHWPAPPRFSPARQGTEGTSVAWLSGMCVQGEWVHWSWGPASVGPPCSVRYRVCTV